VKRNEKILVNEGEKVRSFNATHHAPGGDRYFLPNLTVFDTFQLQKFNDTHHLFLSLAEFIAYHLKHIFFAGLL
jgi:hypothetical protein